MISRRAMFALPVALPFIPIAAKTSGTWTVEEAMVEAAAHDYLTSDTVTGITEGKLKHFHHRGYGFVEHENDDIRITTAMLNEIGLDVKAGLCGITLRVHWISPKTYHHPVATKIDFVRPADPPKILHGNGPGVLECYDEQAQFGFVRMEDRRLVFFNKEALKSEPLIGKTYDVAWKLRSDTARRATELYLRTV